jgi:hypothetical protein
LIQSSQRIAAGAAPTGWPTSGTWTAAPGACRRSTSFPKPVMSPLRTAGLLILRGYLIASVLLSTVKVFSSFVR